MHQWELIYQKSDENQKKIIREVFEFLDGKFVSFGTDYFKFYPQERTEFFCDFIKVLEKEKSIKSIHERNSQFFDESSLSLFVDGLGRKSIESPPYDLWLVTLNKDWETRYQRSIDTFAEALYNLKTRALSRGRAQKSLNSGIVTKCLELLKEEQSKGLNYIEVASISSKEAPNKPEKAEVISKSLSNFRAELKRKGFDKEFSESFGVFSRGFIRFPFIHFEE